MSNNGIRKAFEAQAKKFNVTESTSPSDDSFSLIIEATSVVDTPMVQGCLAACTLLIIPSRTQYGVVLNADLYQAGQAVKNYEVRGEHSAIFQLFLLNPFRWGILAAGRRMTEQAFASLFSQVQDDIQKGF